MKQILALGAGRSAIYFIEYFGRLASQDICGFTVADINTSFLKNELNDLNKINWVNGDLNNDETVINLVEKADIVVSLLPAFMHDRIATMCLNQNKHMATASYVSAHLNSIHGEVKEKKLIFLNECGLDPGIDHMSACKIIHELQEDDYEITSFKSYCGGLITKESIENPWSYKFTWNPRNVILAGQSIAQYLNDGELKYIPPQRIFNTIEKIYMPDGTEYDGYPNRDSMSYTEAYGLQSAKTLIRGTLRYPNYCKGWNALVNIGLTDSSTKIKHDGNLTYKQLVGRFLKSTSGDIKSNLKEEFKNNIDDLVIDLLDSVELLSDKIIKRTQGSVADYLQDLLEEHWKLKPTDHDLVVMQHLFQVKKNNQIKEIKSSLHIEGESNLRTAMAKTVGLPLALGVEKILNDSISSFGVQIPNSPQWYSSILPKLELYGIRFIEEEA